MWLLLMLGHQIARRGTPLTPALGRMLLFWSLFALAQSIGTMTAYIIHDRHDPVWFDHDILAYCLVGAVSCFSVIGPDAGARLHRVAWIVAAVGSASLALQLAGAYGLIGVALSHPWYWDRFRGWSENPAQLAFVCLAIGLLALYLVETAVGHGRKVAAIAFIILPIFVGLLTKTGAFTLSLALTIPIVAALKSWTWLTSSEPRMMLRASLAGIIVLALPLTVLAAIPFSTAVAGHTITIADDLSKDHGKSRGKEAALRFKLWREAWSRGVHSGMLGLGPGPHVAIPPSIVVGRAGEAGRTNVSPHPQVNAVPNFEAHNTPLDLFLQGGLIAAFCFFWIATSALSRAWRARSAGLVAVLCSLLVFGMLMLIIRYPIFWFVIALCLTADFGPYRHRRQWRRVRSGRGATILPRSGSGPFARRIRGARSIVSRPQRRTNAAIWQTVADTACGRLPA
ncbi:MAG: O-antigen ligase family protein [Gemmataceae bacterium]